MSLLFCAAGLLLWFTSPTAGDFWWYDASRHAMNGAFIHDLVVSGGFLSPKSFALAYYERFPAINIGFYPPLFYVISAAIQIPLGVSHAAAQGAVALHAVAVGGFAYALCANRAGKWVGLGAGLVLMFLPGSALWARQVQLDIPAVAWLLAFVWCFQRHLRDGSKAWLFIAAAVLGGAVLTRVQLIFAVAPFALALLLFRYPQRPSFLLRGTAVAVATALALPPLLMLVHLTKATGTLIDGTPGMPARWTVENWLWYLKELPAQVTLAVLVVAVIGLCGLAWRRPQGAERREDVILLLLAATSWVTFTLVSNKDPRFNLPSVALLFILGVRGLASLHRGMAAVALGGLAAFLVITVGWRSEVPRVAGFEQAATVALASSAEGRNVLVSAHRDGNFIYNVRLQVQQRSIGVRRADKLFVDMRIQRELGIRDRGLDEQAVLSLLDRERIGIVVAQQGYLNDQPTMRLFNDLLKDSSRFEELRRIPITGQTDRGEKDLVVYRRR